MTDTINGSIDGTLNASKLNRDLIAPIPIVIETNISNIDNTNDTNVSAFS